MHANGLDYDPINDVIYLSVNYYDEIWVIDHSTTTASRSFFFLMVKFFFLGLPTHT